MRVTSTLWAGWGVMALIASSTPVVCQEPASAAPSLPAGAVSGLGDINLYPKRLVLTDRDRIGTIGVYNRTAVTGEYEITVTDKIMRPDGSIVDLASEESSAIPAGYRPASAMLKWSPRNVQLPGNESQTVRIMPRLPAQLPSGEYRAHFTIVAVPPVNSDGDSIEAATGRQAPAGIGVQILPRFGITIPVIVRVGQTTLQSGISDVRFSDTPDGRKAISVTLTRDGTRSSFGDIVVSMPGTSKPVALLRGVGLYTEITSRTVLVPIDPLLPANALHAGVALSVTYVDDDFAPGTVLARRDYRVP